jgi:hypothetical protein
MQNDEWLKSKLCQLIGVRAVPIQMNQSNTENKTYCKIQIATSSARACNIKNHPQDLRKL